MTQIAIDSRLTLVAFEAMNHWKSDGGFGLHVFHKNNELAGYCSVLHAMQSVGITGIYGRRLRAAVIGFGATARGAVHALNAHGVDDVRVLTNRDVAAVGSPIHSTQIIQMGPDPDAPDRILGGYPGRGRPGGSICSRTTTSSSTVSSRIPTHPWCSSPSRTWPPSLRAASSSTSRATWAWASAGRTRPRSTEPIIEVANGVHYYAVDHSPSYLWNSATWEISEALLPHIDALLAGPATWDKTPTIARAIEIRDGVVRQSRHPVVSAPRRMPIRTRSVKTAPAGEFSVLARGHARARARRADAAPARCTRRPPPATPSPAPVVGPRPPWSPRVAAA